MLRRHALTLVLGFSLSLLGLVAVACDDDDEGSTDSTDATGDESAPTSTSTSEGGW